MGTHLYNFVRSFKDKRITKVFLIDFLFFTIFLLAVLGFNSYMEGQSSQIGVSAEELQELMVNNPLEAKAILSSLTGFFTLFIVGFLFIFIGGFIAYSYTRKLVWNRLSHNRTKLWRWTGINITLLIVYILFLPIFLIIRFLATTLLGFFGITSIYSNNIITLASLLFLVIFTFLTYYNFSLCYQVFNSIGKTFSIIKRRWNRLWRAYLFIMLTTILLSLVTSFLKKQLLYQATLYSIITGISTLLLFAWIRIYLVRIIK